MLLKEKLHFSRKENRCLLENSVSLVGYRVVKVPPKTILQELALQQSIGMNFPSLGVNITIDGKPIHLYQPHAWKIVSAY